MYDLDAAVTLGESVTYCAAVIGGAVVNEDKLKIGKGLREYAVYAVVKVLADIIYRYNNADRTLHFARPLYVCVSLYYNIFYIARQP